MTRSERVRILRESADRYATVAASLGLRAEDAREELAAAWRRLESPVKKEGR